MFDFFIRQFVSKDSGSALRPLQRAVSCCRDPLERVRGLQQSLPDAIGQRSNGSVRWLVG